ncbi:hypothetical protein RchiOBHm_Chr2g0120931 [Rosa chinensis]|uniref:Uncharacterized protein n=1 Tax=Rosa chinensis TaxID=74649 RepID=A0A2P6RSI5_ROSCH|nr:hypothetical protein RchiOBHm_Chr2g0120931 [Rosa chinensis]
MVAYLVVEGQQWCFEEEDQQDCISKGPYPCQSSQAPIQPHRNCNHEDALDGHPLPPN